MTIRFRCPNPACKKILGVPDRLAGRKATCPSCKKAVRIPAPKAPTASAADVEDLAAAALADEPAAAAAEKAENIQLDCPFCGERVEFALEMAGKRAPCPNPECRRIINVPVPAEEKKADWRTAGRDGLQGTRENVERVLEAQQAANIKRGVVSAGALREAGALPTREAPLTTEQKVRRWIRLGLIGVVVVAVAVGAGLWIRSALRRGQQANALAQVTPWLDPKDKTIPRDVQARFTPAMRAELSRALGEFYTHDKLDPKKSIQQAKLQFIGARASLPPPPKNKKAAALAPEWELFLKDLALSQIDLGGGPGQVENLERLPWTEVQKELSRTLARLSSTEGRLLALRAVGGRLIERGQGNIAVALAQEMSTGGKGAKTPPPELRAELAALLLAAGKETKDVPPPKANAPLDLATRLAYAEGWARVGKFDDARRLAQQPSNESARDRLQAALGVAEVALEKGQAKVAADNLGDAVKILQTELKSLPAREEDNVLLWQAAHLAARVGSADQAKALIERIADKGCKAAAQLDVLRRQLADNGPADPDVVADKKALAYPQALEAVARHRASQGQSAEVAAQAEALPDTERQLRPFLYIGIALGEQDGA
jgi:hypothetical protein